MKTYACLFLGHYPVGSCAVAVTNSKEEALVLLKESITDEGLIYSSESLTLNDIFEIPEGTAKVLLNGDY